ncbi:MAG: SRPBCC family protein [Verrucomicrobiae bacterium]|nr:SRPBCC family protein [Verrucomicrobiae bacterium]
MKTIEKSITVRVSVTRAYNQWTQFEEFPQFMEGVKEVKQLDEKRLSWKAEIGGKVKAWDAEIFEQIPDRRIAWRSMGGAKNSGMVNFTPVGLNETEVSLALHYDPEGLAENLGDALGLVAARVAGDLKRFKDFIESRAEPVAGWRGEIQGKRILSMGNPP